MWCFYFFQKPPWSKSNLMGGFSMVFYHPKIEDWNKSRLTEAAYFFQIRWIGMFGFKWFLMFCLRPKNVAIWCGNLFICLLVHMELEPPPMFFKSKMLKWNSTCWNVSHHQLATKNLKQQPYVQPKITNQECLKSMGRFFSKSTDVRAGHNLQSIHQSSIGTVSSCINPQNVV